MNVPQLRFDGFKEEWKNFKINEVTNYVDYRGKTPPKKSEGVQLITAKNVKKGFIDYEISKEYVETDDYISIMSRGVPKEGDVLLTTEAPLGNVAQVDRANIALAQRVIKFRGKEEVLDNTFLKFLFLTEQFQNLLTQKAIGTTVLGIQGKVLHKLPIAVPSYKEQKRLASFFLLIEKRVKKQQEKIEKLEQFKKGMMQKIFSQELRFKDEDGGEFGEWEEKFVNEISIINPKTESLQEEFYYIDLESVDKGRIKDLKTVRVEEAPSRAQRVLMKDDVLFQTVRPYQQNHYYMEELPDKQIVASTGFAQIRASQNARYVYYIIHTEAFSQEVLNRCTGTSYPAINSNHLGTINVPVPSIEEQEKIADFLFFLDKKLNKEKEKLVVLEEQKKGFMQEMFI